MKLTPGQKFGMLTAIDQIGYHSTPSGGRHAIWKWRCDCGGTKEALVEHVKSGHTKSCGCLAKEGQKKLIVRNTTHGDAKNGSAHPLYKIWKGIRKRCLNSKYPEFHYYGGRGIKLLWDSYEDFKRDMEVGYAPGLQIDRVDNNGHYCKDNCRWVTRTVQGNNKRNNRLVTFRGQTKTVSQWARALNIPRDFIYKRLNDGLRLGSIIALCKPDCQWAAELKEGK